MDRVLFVDDEERLLAGMRRNFRKEFDVHTAISGADGVEMVRQSGPFAVIVSDMQMPEMDGVEFLTQAKKFAPDTVRIMLTGNADQQTAVDAINTGEVHQFLTKPCEPPQMLAALKEAAEAYRRSKIERDMLERTFQASVDVLVDVLSLANPSAFGRSARLAEMSLVIAEDVGCDETWAVRSAALLSQIGCVNLPEDLVKAVSDGKSVSEEDWHRYTGHAAQGAKLLERIPRLETVAESVRYQNKNYDGSGTPRDSATGDDIPLIARILRLVLEFDLLRTQGNTPNQSLQMLKENQHRFDPVVLASADVVLTAFQDGEERIVAVNQLASNMVMAEDLHASNGVLLVCRGWEMSHSVIQHLQRAADNGLIEAQVRVFVPE